MFGIRFIKIQPTTYVLQYKAGKVKREGAGLSFFYYSPTTSLVAIPVGSTDVPFIFNEVTADFQEITIQGQVAYRLTDPKKISQLLNFTLDAFSGYVSDDPKKLPQRVVNTINVLTRKELQNLPLRQALKASDALVKTVSAGLAESSEMASVGIEILGLSILAIKPTPETSRALEAEAREQILREADEAIYARRNSAVEQERAIKENELNTEIAVENKKRQIREAQMEAEIAVENKKRQVREAQMEAERVIQEKQHQLQKAEMAAKITLEEKNKDLVTLAVENTKSEADAKAYAVSGLMKAISGIDAKALQALASMGMQPNQLIALAFQELAEKAEKIGQLNVSPELLRELLSQRSKH
ncbi:SPFH domain-containing protein [candidate division KSB1 bacterium]|nr:SPFH domain-containing protein [candidate division KSB1 bacterium]